MYVHNFEISQGDLHKHPKSNKEHANVILFSSFMILESLGTLCHLESPSAWICRRWADPFKIFKSHPSPVWCMKPFPNYRPTDLATLHRWASGKILLHQGCNQASLNMELNQIENLSRTYLKGRCECLNEMKVWRVVWSVILLNRQLY